jgi:2,5-diketo-D-gluconate reductase A
VSAGLPSSVVLNSGTSCPRLGLGTWQIPVEHIQAVVAVALEIGYRGIDTAPSYHNEGGIGAAVAASGIPRDHVFVTTKLWNADHGGDEAVRAFDASVNRLGLDWVDLYLIHWPLPMRDRYVDTWRALEKIHANGRARAIGVSNFTADHIRRLMDASGIVPAVNQVELHPLFQQRELREFHTAHGIATQAWSPLGSGRGLLELPVIVDIARGHGRSAAQVVLRWQLQLGNLVVPKSVTPSRIAENFDVGDFVLNDVELAAIAELDTGQRFGPDPDTFDYG